jgi:DDE superfamily endonuclease
MECTAVSVNLGTLPFQRILPTIPISSIRLVWTMKLESRIVWMNGPFPAAKPDIKIFREDGLKDKIPMGKRAIADNGYRGEPAVISTRNPHEPPASRKFKRRARCRQETFNSRLKNFQILVMPFTHGIPKHKMAFEAVCVICQYQLDESPLFSI